MVAAKAMPEWQYLDECFSYDAESGNLTWKERPLHHFPRKDLCDYFNTHFAGLVANAARGHVYQKVCINDRKYFAHRIIFKLGNKREPAGQIDHVDGDPTNNRIGNLRESTSSQNMANIRAHRDCKVGLKGVTGYGTGFLASIGKNRKVIKLGVFPTAEEAHHAYCRAAKELHGAFANFG